MRPTTRRWAKNCASSLLHRTAARPMWRSGTARHVRIRHWHSPTSRPLRTPLWILWVSLEPATNWTLSVRVRLCSLGIQRNLALGFEELDQRYKFHRSQLPSLQQQYFRLNIDCKVHRGFYYAFLDIQKQVLNTVASYRSQFPHANLMYFPFYLV